VELWPKHSLQPALKYLLSRLDAAQKIVDEILWEARPAATVDAMDKIK
jgi:hypothetical protein